ncbi:hypothetical protein CEQ51_20805 [Pseudomonas thivervalensis]|uniref:Uncharacterized protein n=1 Tax=Pseudomonas thivervalensis TaxID=86265 RepID=A0A2Z4ZWX3_9PSED|nr:hypothetical protein CE140_20255 [Pseudomonas thivervalensis]AXA62412.1 hypothetical protein CEQ51_20805 [Pseudomonas thivervalensis]
MSFRLASRRWSDCIQLYARFVSLYFCIFHRAPGVVYTARNLPAWSINRRQDLVFIGLALAWGWRAAPRPMGKISVFYCVQFSFKMS